MILAILVPSSEGRIVFYFLHDSALFARGILLSLLYWWVAAFLCFFYYESVA